VLLVRAQHAGAIRADLNADDLMALIAGWAHTLQYAGANAKSAQAQRLTAVLFDGYDQPQNTVPDTQRRPLER
jgi:hypothetical protein